MLVFSRFLKYFTEVARVGSIRKASEHLNISASAIDRQILQAEEAFGMALFERLPGGLRLTAAGELLLASAGRWTRDFERVQAQMTDLLGLRRGHVRIALIDALCRGLIPRLIQEFRVEFPGITFEIKALDNIAVQTCLTSGEVDFGLMLNPQSSKDIAVRAHRDVFLGFVTRPDHPLSRSESCRFSQCADYPMVAPAEPLALCEQVQALQAATGLAMKIVAAADNIQMIKSLVADGVGIGVLSSLDVMEEVGAGSLAFTRIADAALKPLTLAMCVGQARQLSGAANLFMTRLEEALMES